MSGTCNAKYVMVNGALIRNPQYQSNNLSGGASTVLDKRALTIVSNPDEVVDSSIRVPKPVSGVITYVQEPQFVNAFATDVPLDGAAILDDIGALFSRLEIPLGLAGHLISLKEFVLHFKIDDSGSMSGPSNLLNNDLSSYTKQRSYGAMGYASRWVEVEDRLHLLMDLLAYVPIQQLKFSFLNNPFVYVTSHLGKTPVQFSNELHLQLTSMFNQFRPSGSTPLLRNIQQMFNEALQSGSPTMHYILTDGVPDGGPAAIRQIENLLLNGRGSNCKLNPVTFLSCSNNPRDIEWMHESEEIAQFVASIHDFRDEQQEVYNDQGPMFPYSRGLWLLANIAAARDPNGLDAMDMHVPLSKGVVDALLGRVHSNEEYRAYFTNHPTYVGGMVTRTGYQRHRKKVFESDFSLFVDVLNVDLIPSVRCFKSLLAQRLKADIDNEDDNSEDREVRAAEDYVCSVRSSFAADNEALLQKVAFEKQLAVADNSTSRASRSSLLPSAPILSEDSGIPVASIMQPYSSSDFYSYPTLGEGVQLQLVKSSQQARGQIYLDPSQNQFVNFNKYSSIVCGTFVAEKHARSSFTSFFLNIFGNPWRSRFFKVYVNKVVYYEDDASGQQPKGTFPLNVTEAPVRNFSTSDSLYYFDLKNHSSGEVLRLRFDSEASREAAFDVLDKRIPAAQGILQRMNEGGGLGATGGRAGGVSTSTKRIDV